MRAAMILVALATASAAAEPAKKKPVKPREPLALVVLIDRSVTMKGDRLDFAKQAAAVAAETLESGDLIAVIAFDTGASTLVRLQRASNPQLVRAGLEPLTAGGQTAFVPPLVEAAAMLGAVNARAKHVVMISDGGSRPDGIDDVMKQLEHANITVTTIGLDPDLETLRRIADRGRARFWAVEDVAVLPKIIRKEIADVSK